MDAKKFGTFIATLRKENNMTQVELAQKLQVTDKAVSKWERGLGFPDINTIEPLADALGVSVLEIMRSERIAETKITQDTASAALTVHAFHPFARGCVSLGRTNANVRVVVRMS